MQPVPDQRARAEEAAYSDETSFVALATMVVRHWRMMVLLPLLFGAIAAVSTLTQQRKYTASASFVLNGSEGGTISGAAAIARQFGVDMSSRVGQSPEFFRELLGRTVILRQVVESEYVVPQLDGGTEGGTLIDLYRIEEKPRTPAWQSAVQELRRRMSTSLHKETGVVGLAVTETNPLLAEAVATRILGVLQEFNLEVQRSRALEEGRFVSERLSEARAQLERSEQALQRFLQANRQFLNSPELTFDHERLQRQVAMRQEVYTSLLRLHEQARIDGIRDTPVLTVIDSPEGAALPQGRGTVLRTLLGVLVGLLVAVFLALTIGFARRQRQLHTHDYEEFTQLSRRVVEDVRHPARWWRKRRA